MLSMQTFAALKSMPDLLSSLAAEDLSPANTLSLLTHLRKTIPSPLAVAALETARLRQKAADKFIHAGAMFFTAEALQQATAQVVAEHHARLLASYRQVADLGCGIGGDAIILGQGAAVLALDRDVLRLQMARENAVVYHADVTCLQADITMPLPFRHVPAAFFDPARRTDQKRIFSVKDYLPPLEIIQEWDFQALLVKISPGVRLAELAHLRAGIEFVSLNGELKEALLHCGELAFDGCCATHLPSGERLFSMGYAAPPLATQPLSYLYEPDPAVIRAGLLAEVLVHLGLTAYRLDETIAYMTGDQAIAHHWLRCWRIDEWMPFNLKKLRARLTEKGVGSITVKKRGSPILPEEFQKMLRLKKADGHAVVVLTQLRGQPIVLISYELI